MWFELGVLTLAGFITGFSKFSVGGMGLLILPVLMLAFPGATALGIIMPLFLITDLLTLWPYRRGADWGLVCRLVPAVLVGICIGGVVLADIDVAVFSLILGMLILMVLLLSLMLDRLDTGILRRPGPVAVVGVFTGVISLLANAAGPVMSLFLLQQKLSKHDYVATRCWMATLVNLSKVPVLIWLGLLNQESVAVSFQAIPGLLLGGLLGYCFLNLINPVQFKWIIRGLAAVAATKLLLFS